MQGDASEGIRAQRVLAWQQLVTIAAVYCCVALLFRPSSLLSTVSSGDDASYISHAFTIALDFDLRYQNEPVFAPGLVHQIAPSGRVPAHPIGPGLMAAPFVAVFSILDRITDNPIIQDHMNYAGSWSIFGFFIAAASWFLLGSWLYFDALDAIGIKTRRWTILLFATAIGVPYYVLLRPTMGHAFEFSSVALVFWGSVRVMAPGKLGRIVPEICMATGMTLTLLVRWADMNILLLPIVVWGLLLLGRRGKWPAWTLRGDGAALGIAAVCGGAIFVGFNRALYGAAVPGIGDTYGSNNPFFVTSRGGLLENAWGALRDLPLLWQLLTTSEFGLLWSAPILPAGAIAIAAILASNWRQRPGMAAVTFVFCAVYVAVPLSIILILKTTGESFGYRYLFDLLPICLLGMGLILSDAANTRLAKAVHPVLVLLSLWALVGGIFIDTNPALSSKHGANAYGRLSAFSYVGYETALMKAVVTPRSWLDMAARRLPGFVVVRLAPDPVRLGAPSKTQDTINRIRQVRSSYFYAIVLFWLFYPLCLALLCDRVFRSRVFGFLCRMPATAKADI